MSDFYVSKCLSGHMYYGSPYETDDSCGNCDGAKCERCKERYRVTNFSDKCTTFEEKTFKTKEEAEAFVAEMEKLYS